MPRGPVVRPARLVKRYGNRKLYDTVARRHVTLEDLATLVARGENVEVRDQRTGDDLTNLTLTQALLEGIRQSTARIPRQVLTHLVRLAAGPKGAWGRWEQPHETAGRARDEVERIVGRLLGRGRLSLDEAFSLRQEVGQLVHRLVSEAQAGVEGRLRALLDRGEGVAGLSLNALRDRLAAFETYLETKKGRVGRRPKGRRPGRRSQPKEM